MQKYKEGDEVTITFKGVISRIYDPVDAPSGSMSVKRNHTTTVSYFEANEIPHLSIIVHRPAFQPKSGEVYMLRAAGSKGDWTTWYVMRKSYLGEPEMVSPSEVYSLQTFKDAYVNESWELVRANVEPE